MNRFKTRGSSTPWGVSQSTEHVADGITFHSTACHGGYELSADREDQLQRLFVGFKTIAGPRWYEEDCDAAVVPIAFPDCFDAENVAVCVSAVTNFAKYYPRYKPVIDYLAKRAAVVG